MASIMDLVEDMLRDLTTGLCESRVYTELLQDRRSGDSGTASEMISVSGTIESRWAGMMSKPWPRITYTEAIEVLQKSGTVFEYDAVWGHGLQAEHERFIATHVGKGKPVFVTQYPRDIKAFYMLPSTTSPQLGPTVDCFDLLVPESCEIAGGSMREYRYSELLNAMQSHGVIHDGDSSDEALGSLKWYADLRRWGTAPHGGFGIGFDRLLGYLAGVQNIREVVGFPRWYGRCDC
jgi:asparaginyl-tRNA synthetase